MPTDRDDDVELSAMLRRAEPPKSPRHVDEAILNYAAQKASESPSRRESGWAFMNINWLQRNWVPVAATLSVAVLAVSLSLQTFTEPNFNSTSMNGGIDLAFNESVSLAPPGAESRLIETDEQGRASGSATLQNDTPRSIAINDDPVAPAPTRQALSDTSVAQRSAPLAVESAGREEQEKQIAADREIESDPVTARTLNSSQTQSTANQLAVVDADRTRNGGSRSPRANISIEDSNDLAAQASALSADTGANVEVEEVVVTASSVRRNASSLSSSAQRPQSSLAESLLVDAALQETVIIVLRRSLGVREQPSVADQQELSNRLTPLIDSYRQFSDQTILEDIQNRYVAARSESLDSRLPDSVEELVSVLEAVEY